jgi:site-specific DNA recombinase
LLLQAPELLEGYARSSASREDEARVRLSRLRQSHKEVDAGIARLLELVEKGLMDAEDSILRDRLVGLRLQRDELFRDIDDYQRRLSLGGPTLTLEKIEQLGLMLRDKLYDDPAELRQAYARLMLQEVAVTRDEIRISGSKAKLARCASTGAGDTAPGVLSFVRELATPRGFEPPTLRLGI